MKKHPLNQKGFTAIEGLLITLIVLFIGFIGYYVHHSQQQTDKTLTSVQSESASTATTKKSKTSQASTSPVSNNKVSTAGWISFSSAKGQFSLKYPSTWVQASDKINGGSQLFDRDLDLGANSSAAGQWIDGLVSNGSTQIIVESISGDDSSEYSEINIASINDNMTSKDVSINNIQGKLYTSTAKTPSAGSYYPEGTYIEEYVFHTNGNTYVAHYVQNNPGWPNVQSDFDAMITQTLQFN